MKALALLLVSVLLLESCSATLAGSGQGPAEVRSDSSGAAADAPSVETPKRSLWPWAVAGTVVGVVAAGVIVALIAAAFADGFPIGDDFGFGSGGQDSGGGQPLPVLADNQR
jgi:hypothetical protein